MPQCIADESDLHLITELVKAGSIQVCGFTLIVESNRGIVVAVEESKPICMKEKDKASNSGNLSLICSYGTSITRKRIMDTFYIQVGIHG